MKTVKRIISIIFALIILTGIFALAPSVFAHAYDTGDIITFGMYPQSEVTDYSLKSSLESQSKNWISYRYYSGTGDELDGKMTPGDYMRYCDVDYGGKKYRGVTFDSYRPKRTGFLTTTENSSQDENGYYANNTYWFEYEPIEWRILDASQNLIMSEMLLNSIAFNDYVYYVEGTEITYGDSSHTFYCNNYVKSSIRTWLNNGFFDLAFDSSEKSRIITTSLDNGSDGTADDRIFLLSYSDSMNTAYGFSASSNVDRSRMAEGTDYAKCQGLWVDEESGYSYCRLRTQGQKSFFTCDIKYDGSVHDDYRPFATGCGVRPVMRLSDLNSVSATASATQTYRDNAGDTDAADNNREAGNNLIKTNGEDYKTGDIIEFGTYPQSKVTDYDLIGKLNKKAGSTDKWDSYNYYEGGFNAEYAYSLDPDELLNGTMSSSDFMKYKDIAYRGEKYRGVYFENYRSFTTGLTNNTASYEDLNMQYANGYYYDTIYWFKYEPVKWRVADLSTGLLICDTIIDSQPFEDYVKLEDDGKTYGNTIVKSYAGNFSKSSIKDWLKYDFSQFAFNSVEMQNIIVDTVSTKNSIFYVEDFEASAFLPDLTDLSSLSNRGGSDYPQLTGSDYAKCQGLFVSNENDASKGFSSWWLRIPGSYSEAKTINSKGKTVDQTVNLTFVGVVPAIRVKNIDTAGFIKAKKREMLPYTVAAAGIILAATIAAIILILRMRKSYFKAGINNSAPQRKQRVKKTPSTRKPQTSPDPKARRQPQAQRQCPYCGGPLSPGAQFCKNCGNRVQ